MNPVASWVSTNLSKQAKMLEHLGIHERGQHSLPHASGERLLRNHDGLRLHPKYVS